MKFSMIVTTIFLGTAGCASQVSGPDVDQTKSFAVPSTSPAVDVVAHAQAATASLTTLAHLVKPERNLGFQSPSEAAASSLAEPLPMYMIGLNQLQTYHAGDDPRPLLMDQASVMYPVTVGGAVRSSMIVRKQNGQWTTTQYGRANLAKTVHDVRMRVSAARGVGLSDLSLVEIPAMSTRMLAHEEKGVVMLTPLTDVPGTDLHAGTTVTADEALAKLQPLAAQTNGNQPN
jgi:hypothetical protein